MKIAILSRDGTLYSCKRLREAAEDRGHSIDIIDPLSCYMNINPAAPTIHYRGCQLERYDAVIPRIGSAITFYGTAVLRQFELLGSYPLNESVAITRARDKLRSLQLLARQGIDLPITGFAHSPDDTGDLIELVGGAPLHGEGERAGGRWRIGPALRLAAQSAQFAIEMKVTNQAERPQPLRYVCSLNYDCIPDAVFRQNLPTPALLGDTIGQELLCSDDLTRYVDQAEFFMLAPQGRRYVTRFATEQFNYGFRRIAVQGNRRLLAFIQPANCRPNAPEGEEGVMLGAGKTRTFCVTTGVV